MSGRAGAAGGRKRIAVIGAGPVGLVTLKELAEHGHDVVAFEVRRSLGGVFTDTYQDLQLTSSSAVTSFGSFVVRDVERPVLWQAGEYVEYLAAYARRFDLERRIRFGTRVRSLKREPGGGWCLRAAEEAADGGEADEQELRFDHVVVCVGSNARPQLPPWADPARFDGEILHSATIRDGSELAGRRVLVVGMGESGSDVALMAARNGTACAISTRNGPGYVIPRTYRGLPTDLDTNRCYHSLPRSVGGHPVVRFKVRIEDALQGDDVDAAVMAKAAELNRARGISPFHRFATKSTAFVEAIVHHGAQYRPGVAEMHPDGVTFTDGTTYRCDVIVCCTGFTPHFPFLEEHEPDLARRARNARALYKHMIVPELGTEIAWIGYVRPGVGSIPPCAEMQARYLALLIGGERALPAHGEMLEDVRMHAELDLAQFPEDAERLSTLTDFFRFMETMAEAVGCRPSVRRLLLRDPRTALRVLFGPLSAAQYRLEGPGADPEAARAALRRMPTMPWPVLAYELMLIVGCWALGLTREPWRRRRAAPSRGTGVVRPALAALRAPLGWLRGRSSAEVG